jgi:hypothetical protein
MPSEYIYYTGVGAKKSGKHTITEFVKIMNREFGIACSNNLIDQQYEPCVTRKKMDAVIQAKILKDPNYKMSAKTVQKRTLVANKCTNYKTTTRKRRACTTSEYIKFSGAEKRK